MCGWARGNPRGIDGRAFRIVTLIALLHLSGTVGAHDFSRSESKLEIRGREVRVLLSLDLLESTVDVNQDARVSYEELDAAIERIYAGIKTHYLLDSDGPPVSSTLERYELVDEHVVQMHLVYTFAHDVSRLEVTSRLYEITKPDHRHLVSTTGVPVQAAVLDASVPRMIFNAGDTSSGGTRWWPMVSFALACVMVYWVVQRVVLGRAGRLQAR